MRRTGAKNFDASNEEASTKVSRAVRALQDKLPLSRVIYASATGVSEIKNMAYAERLGLWGAGTSFADFKTFADTLEKRGVGALELLALELQHVFMGQSVVLLCPVIMCTQYSSMSTTVEGVLFSIHK